MTESSLSPDKVHKHKEQLFSSDTLIQQKAVTSEEKAAEQKLRIREDEHHIRTTTNNLLAWISVWWLFLTEIIVILQGFSDYYWFSLSDSVMIAFLTTSLGTVLGLWGIGLGYYFFKK